MLSFNIFFRVMLTVFRAPCGDLNSVILINTLRDVPDAL